MKQNRTFNNLAWWHNSKLLWT